MYLILEIIDLGCFVLFKIVKRKRNLLLRKEREFVEEGLRFGGMGKGLGYLFIVDI